MPESNARLVPNNVKPVKYQITLEPDLKEFNFTGHEKIEIQILEPTSAITLNSVEIEIHSCNIELPDGSNLSAQSISYDEDQETATFEFGIELASGSASLDF